MALGNCVNRGFIDCFELIEGSIDVSGDRFAEVVCSRGRAVEGAVRERDCSLDSLSTTRDDHEDQIACEAAAGQAQTAASPPLDIVRGQFRTFRISGRGSWSGCLLVFVGSGLVVGDLLVDDVQ